MQYINRIKELIKKKNLTLKDIADKIGMSRPGFTDMLNSGDMKVSTLNKIAECLDVSASYILEGESYQSKDVDKVFDILKEIVKSKMK